MNPEASKTLDGAHWEQLTPLLIRFAHYQITRYKWRGLRVSISPGANKLTIEGAGAEDFVQEAVERLYDGRRTYRTDLDPEANLRSVIKSLISNFYKKAKHLPIEERTLRVIGDDADDPIENLKDSSQPDCPTEVEELRCRQREMLAALKEFVSDDENLSFLVMAFEDDIYKPADVEAATGIPAAQVSELKRKLEDRADKFLKKYPEYAELKPLEAP